MKKKIKKFHFRLKPEAKQQFQEIRENKLLILGVLIGVVGNLFANIIDSFFKNGNSYPIIYSLSITLIFAFVVFLTLKTYFKWKFKLLKFKMLITKFKKNKKS